MVDFIEPTAWFDQFIPGLANIHGNDQWCARHWAPAVLCYADGISASIEMMQVFVEEVAPDAKTPAALEARLQAIGRVCCTLGDDKMFTIWGHWGPPQPPRLDVTDPDRGTLGALGDA